jgi:hypothetical protein
MIFAKHQAVYPALVIGYLVLKCYVTVFYTGNFDQIFHPAEGILKRKKFGRLYFMPEITEKRLIHNIRDPVVKDILSELFR